MSMGLDLGASRFRALRKERRRLIGCQAPTGYLAIADTPDHVRLLNQARISNVQSDDARLVLGSEVDQIASALERPIVPSLPEGRIPLDDPLSRQVVAELLNSVVHVDETDRVNHCSVVLPGGAAANEPTGELILQVLKLRGLHPTLLTSAEAICLAELGCDQFTGVVINQGASETTITLMESGSAVATADAPCGGDWIARRLAEELQCFLFDSEGHRYLDTLRLRTWIDDSTRDLANVSSDADELLGQTYREILTSLMARFRKTIIRSGANGPRNRPLPIVCAGGPTLMGGFADAVTRLWAGAGIDLPVDEVRICPDATWTVARGCLIHAEVGQSQPTSLRVA